MEKKIKLFANCKCALSESPIWDERDHMLYWRGYDGEVFRKRINDDVEDFECFPLNIGKIGSIVIADDDGFLLFAECGKVWKWKPLSEPVLYKDFNKSYFNDVMVDPKGRVFCGMLAENYFDREKRGKNGSLWMLNEQKQLVCIEDDISQIPNGIRFSPQMDKMYFAVTDDKCVYRYDYDLQSGELSNKTVFVTGYYPDGIAMDCEGNLWVTDSGKSLSLRCYTPEGELREDIYIPEHRTISVAFGGEGRRYVFVTTAHENLSKTNGGQVYWFEAEIAGAEEFVFRLKEERS